MEEVNVSFSEMFSRNKNLILIHSNRKRVISRMDSMNHHMFNILVTMWSMAYDLRQGAGSMRPG